MEASTILPLVVNGGVAAVVVVLLIFKQLVPGWTYQEKREEVAELKAALAHERDRSDAAVAAANATKDVLLSLRGRFSDADVRS